MGTTNLKSRTEIPDQYKWHLSDIYVTEQDWEQDFKKLEEMIPQITNFKGEINSSQQLLSCLQLREQGGMLLEKLYGYAMMGKDQDNTNDQFLKLADRIASLATKVSSSAAFIEPEILALPSDDVLRWVEEVEELQTYRHSLSDLMRTKPHVLPAEQEELLAKSGDMAQAASNIFKMFNNADLKFPLIKDEDNKDVELTHGRYIQFMESRKREVREGAFKAMYSTYGNWKNTLATTYTAAVKKTLFYSNTRKYDSSLEAALDADNVPTDVYHNLIKTVHEYLPSFYRYTKIRKQLLGVEELHMYDLYVPMVKEIDMKIERTQAIEMVQTGLQPLGEQYLQDLAGGLNGGWIDWYENRGKSSGAYSWGAYGVHPFVLMNYQDNVDNMFTLAHEMGHAMHSFYSDKHQDYLNAGYTIFVAEVASTLNESLVMHDLLAKTTDIKEKMYLLNHYLEQFRGTLFRQTMFAEFELIVHDQVGQGKPMTAESLSQIYYELNQKYYGPDVVSDPEIAMEWARIPHFYRPFYVYKYATGFSAAVALSKQILTEQEPAVQRYLTFLSSGGSDYPLNLLKKAGVDMTTPKPIVAAMQVFDSLLDQMEDLITKG